MNRVWYYLVIPVKKKILECLINLSDQKGKKRKQSDLNIPIFISLDYLNIGDNSFF